MASDSETSLEGIGPGKLTPAQARELGKRGGRAKANKWKLMDSLGLLALAKESTFVPYRQAGEALLKAQSLELTKACGGKLGPGPLSLLSTWALQMAASRWCFAKGFEENNVELVEAGSRIANQSRMSLMAAEALARQTLDRIELAEELKRKAAEEDRHAGGERASLPPWMAPDGPA